jgi:hypothetical protein
VRLPAAAAARQGWQAAAYKVLLPRRVLPRLLLREPVLEAEGSGKLAA